MVRTHLDYETRCALDLRTVGLARYLAHPSFEVLLTSWAEGDGPVRQVEGFWCPPSPVKIHAFNAPFERGVIARVAGHSERDRHQWRCTMVHAYSMGFTGNLAAVGAQIGLPADQQKQARGKRLVTKFCTTRRPSVANPDLFWTRETASAEWEEFAEYNRQDVVAERAIWIFLEEFWPWTPQSQQLWELDCRINERGIPVDAALVDAALDVADRLAADIEERCVSLTDGVRPNQVARLLAWARDRGYPHDSLGAEMIGRYLPECPDPELAAVLRVRLEAAQSAVRKFAAIRDKSHGGRVRNTLQMRGASRTGRWAGRDLQIQNLKRPAVKDPAVVAQLLTRDPEGFALFYSLDDLGSLIRNAIRAPEGRRLVVSDLGSIEMVVLAWMTKDPELCQIFTDGRDPYKVFATLWLGEDYDTVEKPIRNLCKPPMLGCGYGLGASGLVRYAGSMGVTMGESTALGAVQAYRGRFPAVRRFWGYVEASAREAIRYPGQTLGEPIGFPMLFDGRFLRVRLPSGRILWYDRAEVDEDGEISYMGQDQYTRQWVRLRTWGGKLVENLDQAIACDLLAHALICYDAEGGTLVGHVHDEMIAEERTEHADQWLQVMNRCFTTPPRWFQGLPLKSEGYVCPEYRKG